MNPSPQWADGPLSLIPTLPFSKDTTHSANYVATQMALAHNGLIRGLNSIYLQALQIPHSSPSTVQDFLTYCQCWCEAMIHHHETEEEYFFPDIERITGVQGLMESNMEQHRAFTPGFEAFDAYAKTCVPENYDGEKVKNLIDAFAIPLHRHLVDEIDTMRELHRYDSQEIRGAYKKFQTLSMQTDKFRIGPLVFGTSDRAFEGGIHNFPPAPFFVPYIIHYAFEGRHRGAWQFSPCTTWRDRRELPFVSTTETS